MRKYHTGHTSRTKFSRVKLPPEPKNEATIEDATELTESETQMRNIQLKLQWELKCQKSTEAGIICGECPWTLCDQNAYLLSISV